MFILHWHGLFLKLLANSLYWDQTLIASRTGHESYEANVPVDKSFKEFWRKAHNSYTSAENFSWVRGQHKSLSDFSGKRPSVIRDY